MSFSPLFDSLVKSLTILPGVGKKSAQRMALSLLETNDSASLQLADSIRSAVTEIRRCARCRNITENDLCDLCSSPRRDQSTVCVVESPMDVIAIENSSHYSGLFFVLHGKLSPLDGVGPEELGFSALKSLASRSEVVEVILATNLTVEGEATAHYLSQLLVNSEVHLTRIAHGVPAGGELEYVDGGTLSLALNSRKSYG